MSPRTTPRPVYVSLRRRHRWKDFPTWNHWRFDTQPQCKAGDYFLFRKGTQVVGRATITHMEQAELPAHPSWNLPARLVWKVYWDPHTLVDYRLPLHTAQEQEETP